MTYDLNRIAELLRNEKWTWAKTMPGIPHEYIVRDKCLMGSSTMSKNSIIPYLKDYLIKLNFVPILTGH